MVSIFRALRRRRYPQTKNPATTTTGITMTSTSSTVLVLDYALHLLLLGSMMKSSMQVRQASELRQVRHCPIREAQVTHEAFM